MKLIIAIVQDDDVSELTDKLTENKFSITRLASTGGFLKSGNTTLLIGVEKERVEKVYEIIEKICRVRKVTTTLSSMTLTGDTYVPYPMEIKVGGATVFTLDVERYEQI
ncbi:cyclic-di-AMP receptor [Dethiothermospora halolimnae]|uniref:cyclic-di-AMP receptor n=1 Tax=Dethiothermospora halolimnae TaxID=3114390 RepID=UPI003CCBC6D3